MTEKYMKSKDEILELLTRRNINLNPENEDEIKAEKKAHKLERNEDIIRERLKIRNEGHDNINRMRVHWSIGLLVLIFLIIIVDLFIVVMVGWEKFTFTGSQLPLFAGQSILKIMGMAWIVVGFLFDKKYYDQIMDDN